MNCNLRNHSERRFCCGACGRAFSSQVVFDKHRRGGRCTLPSVFGAVPHTIPGLVGDGVIWGMGGSWEGPDDD